MQNKESTDQPPTGSTNQARRRLLFYRDFRSFTGGHLKVWHYFEHDQSSRFFKPEIYLTPESFAVPDNPWTGIQPPPMQAWQPEAADLLFLGGGWTGRSCRIRRRDL
jgi:hypothetical protein